MFVALQSCSLQPIKMAGYVLWLSPILPPNKAPFNKPSECNFQVRLPAAGAGNQYKRDAKKCHLIAVLMAWAGNHVNCIL